MTAADDIHPPPRGSEAITISCKPVRRWPEVLPALLLALAGAALSWAGSGRLPARLFTEEGFDLWFDADVPRIVGNMTDRNYPRQRTNAHPLFPMTVYPLTALGQAAGLSPVRAMRATAALGAALWTALLYFVLRAVTGRRLDAITFTLLGTVSASAVFWLTVPETYVWGSLSILLALGLVALAEARPVSSVWSVGASALTLSYTLTNWMAGLIAAFVLHGRREAIRISLAALLLVGALWSLQRWAFPGCEFFLDVRQERARIPSGDAGGPLACARSFLLHSMITPEIGHRDRARRPLTVQDSRIGGAGRLSGAGALLWLALLVWGGYVLCFGTGSARFRRALGLILAGQFVLHLLYGDETFLYSMHFAPLLVLVAALGACTRLRPIVLAFTLLMIPVAAVNNAERFAAAIRALQSPASLPGSTAELWTGNGLPA